MKTIAKLILPTLLSIGIAAVANAQASRTWVSGVGDDANPCSRTAPCKTFAGAISKTATGGEMDALDPGGFGALTITKAILIDGGGDFASILVSGTNGIVVQAPATDNVVLRRIAFDGIGAGIDGIKYNSGKSLTVDGCIIFGFTGNGINAVPNNGGANSALAVRDTLLENNATSGILLNPASGTIFANISNVRQSGGNANAGLDAFANAKVSIQDSDFSQNTASSGITARASSVEVDVADTVLANSAIGVFAGVAGGGPTVRLTRCTITGNTTSGITINPPSNVFGFGSNLIDGNTAGNTVTATHTQQ